MEYITDVGVIRVPERHEYVENYHTSQTERDLSHAEHIADSIAKTETPLASTVALIPVAAHSEMLNIERSLQLYAAQDATKPFSVILGLNSPARESANPAITEALDLVQACVKRYPHLDVRYAMTFYDDPVIGMIRRDLWNGALLQARREGAYSPESQHEYIGINHDIDTVSMSPRYIDHIQQYYERAQRRHNASRLSPVPLPVRSTLVKHAPSFDHPNISRGAFWMDFQTRKRGGAYEEGMVIPFSHYASRGGFPADRRTYETEPLWNPYAWNHAIPGTVMETSSRRYVDRLRHGYGAIWSNETFGPDDACRTDAIRPDITPDELEHVIEDFNFETIIAGMANHAIRRVIDKRRPITQDATLEQFIDANVAMNQSLTLAASALYRVARSPRLAQRVLEMVDDDKVTAPILACYFEVNFDDEDIKEVS